MDAIRAEVNKVDQLREERKSNHARFGDLDEVIARYAVWTGALTGGAADNPVLDDVAFQIGKDDEHLLREAKCDRFKEYYAAVNGRLLDSGHSASNAYRQYLLAYFKQPPAAQTFVVTLLLGALGALGLNTLRMSKVGWWADHPDPLWGDIFVGPLIGALVDRL
jgi:hypothetical protein